LKPSIQYFYATDTAHNNDDDEDPDKGCAIPIAKACWLETAGPAAGAAGDPRAAAPGQVCMVQVNHCIKPHMFFRHPDGRFGVADVDAGYNAPSIGWPK